MLTPNFLLRFTRGSWLVAVALLVAGTLSGRGATVFQDGFEGPALGAGWTTGSTNNGRVTVTSSFSPATGAQHLVVDDSVNDATSSVAEAVLQLDLTNKKNVVLTFNAKSLGNEPNAPPAGNFTGMRNFDGVSISTDGGTTWRVVQSLAAVAPTWTSYTITLDSTVAQLVGAYGPGFLIRFSEYDNAPAPEDGIAIDDVLVTADDNQFIQVELPYQVMEGSGGNAGYVLLSVPPAADVTLALSASPAGQLVLPATVTIPAGQTAVSFDFDAVDDSLLNMSRPVTVLVSAPGLTNVFGIVTVMDDEPPPVATLSLPAQLAEGVVPSSNNATLTLDRVATVPVTILLSALPANELAFPASVTVPAGQLQVGFIVRAVDDNRIDGNVLVTMTAKNATMASATAQTTTLDNEAHLLTAAPPVSLREGGTATGLVTLSGTITTDMVVHLTSANPAALTVPASVTIPAGATAINFTCTAVNNNLMDGTRSVQITASITAPGFSVVQGTATTIYDDELSGFRFTGLADVVDTGNPFTVTVTAVDVDGNQLNTYSGPVYLGVSLPDGSIVTAPFPWVNLSGGYWTGSFTPSAVPIGVSPLRLVANDGAGHASSSAAFDNMRQLPLTTTDLVWDALRRRFYACVPGGVTSGYASSVVAIDPATMQITASVPVGQNPRRLALTSGGEALYVALSANGTIAKIDPESFTVAYLFPLGSDPTYGPYFPGDIAALPGQPDSLVVSRYAGSGSAFGAAVYDHGVPRATVYTSSVSSSSYPMLLPSADPTQFFGYDGATSTTVVRQLRVDAGGISGNQGVSGLFSGLSSVGAVTTVSADGNKLLGINGVVVDGALGRRLGAFVLPYGPVACTRLEVAAGRAYCLEPAVQYGSTFGTLSAYDLNTYGTIRRQSLSYAFAWPSSLMRWGAGGLAFRAIPSSYNADGAVVVISGSQLVPAGAPADVAVAVDGGGGSAAGGMVTYTVTATNRGPNVAANVQLRALLSDGQTGLRATSSRGVYSTSVSSATGLVNTVTLPVGSLAVGASATLIIKATPQQTSTVWCNASVVTSTPDPVLANNAAFKQVQAGFNPAINITSTLKLAANNLLYDSTRQRLWATLTSAMEAPMGRSLVAINPLDGSVSAPFPLNASPVANCMALSANGRYLYVGLGDATEMARVDLSTTPPTLLRIPLTLYSQGTPSFARDVKVLAGDGTSFIMCDSANSAAYVYDGTIVRSKVAMYAATRLEATPAPDVFDCYVPYLGLGTLKVDAGGVTLNANIAHNYIDSYQPDIRSAGNLLFTSSGYLLNATDLSLVASFQVTGRPLLDGPNHRAYSVYSTQLQAFDTTHFTVVGSLTVTPAYYGDWAQSLVRWGADGFAMLINNASGIVLTRWSQLNTADANHNGIADSWENAHFNSLAVNMGADTDHDGMSNALEYLFGTAPEGVSSNPLKVKPDAGTQPAPQIQGQGINAIARTIVLSFPRRSGLPAGYYHYESSSDLQNWSTVVGVVETVVSTAVVNGTDIENIGAAVPLPASAAGFVRLVTAIP